YSIEARALGFEPRSVAVDLSSRRASVAELVLGSRVTTLETVHVMGRTTRAMRDRLTFLERKRRGGTGHFLSADDIARFHPVDATDALRRLPGVEVLPRRSGPIDVASGAKQVWMHGGMGGRRCKPD